ncbi:MAG: hypothetical protein ACREJ2_10990 [Planctomycetota bacterium]
MNDGDRSELEAWRKPEAVASRTRWGWGLAIFVLLLFVVPVVAKYFHWF